jgi:hypothetical protein
MRTVRDVSPSAKPPRPHDRPPAATTLGMRIHAPQDHAALAISFTDCLMSSIDLGQ